MQNDLSVKPVLSDTLAVILPTVEQTWLLRACLLSGAPARQAWAAWQEQIGHPMIFLRNGAKGIKNLLPLLSVSLCENGVAIDSGIQTWLRTAYLRDELRNKSYSRICRTVLSALTKAGIATIVLKGTALAETVYPDPVLQHSHYLDILIKEGELSRAVRLLPSLGFASVNGILDPKNGDVEVEHESGLPLVLHQRLFPTPFYDVALPELWARSQIQTITDGPARIMSPADNLLHVCGQVFWSPHHELLRWACDAWFIIRRHRDLDWDVLLRCARRSRLALPLSVTIGYLAKELMAPVPSSVLERLYTSASQTDTVGREAALHAARVSARGGFRNILKRARGWHAKGFVLKWIFFPSPEYLRWVRQVHHSWLLPFHYLYRPLRYIARRIWSFCKARVRSRKLQKEQVIAPLGSQG